MTKSKIRNVEQIDSPREKLMKYSADKLTNAELLAILLRTGTQERNVLMVARDVLKKFKGVSLSSASVAQLRELHGVGEVKALELVACFELGRRFLKDKITELVLSPLQVWQNLTELRANKKEHFVVFFLNTQNQIIQKEIVSIGTLNTSLVHPREVFEPAIRYLASHIVVAHNHPSGSLVPSDEDLSVTKRLASAGRLLGIELLDHVIVTATQYLSFKDRNLL